MNIKATLLASVLSLPLVAGAALAADTGNALVTAAKQGRQADVQTILKSDAKQEIVATQGGAALIWAASHNDKAMVDLLLSAGANPTALNDFGATALYAAADFADAGVTKSLLAAGADPNVALKSGETPLMSAARKGNVDTVRALLEAGADPNVKEKNGGQTALMWAASGGYSAVTAELVRHKADVNARSKSGSTALMFAARGDLASTRTLLDAGADPNVEIPDWKGTALGIASTMGQPDIVEALLAKGADINHRDDNSFTALHSAVRDSDYGEEREQRARAAATVKVLLAHGADPNARLHQEKPTVRALDEVEFEGATPIALAAEVNNLDAIKLLVDAGGDPNIPTVHGTTPLMLASGAATDVQRARSIEERGLAIHTARYLVEHGADVNAAGQFGWTALHSATYQGITDLMEFLISKGANINAMDGFRQTPLSISLSVLTKEAGAHRLQIPRRYRPEVAELLLKMGATPLEKSGVNVVLTRSGAAAANE
ncbi:MAG: ankyrin repeat domain-containing protein [Xanthobacteraceae bacterium]|nr:ankyrin repeat domain-containing protein [Xanthobacteraceae bacterium]